MNVSNPPISGNPWDVGWWRWWRWWWWWWWWYVHKLWVKTGNYFIQKSISNQFYLSSIAWGVVAQSPEPGAHVLNARAFRIELEFRNVGFCGEKKTGVPGEKPLGAEKRTNNKLNPHMTSSPGIDPRPHWWKASALTSLLIVYFANKFFICLF